MKFLALKFAGPLQSWGSNSRFTNIRRTENFPTKSGILGLIASAAGIKRDETNLLNQSGLLDLKVAVRIDRQGTLTKDYQIIDTGAGKKISNRDYLSDAIFLVGVYGDDELILNLEKTLKNPRYALFLGRKSCVPEPGLFQSIADFPDETSFLSEFKFLPKKNSLTYKEKLQPKITCVTVVETNDILNGEIISDQPQSFSSTNRLYVNRTIVRSNLEILNPYYVEPAPEHDPLAILEESK